jgi:Flp pilus assembly protein TadD
METNQLLVEAILAVREGERRRAVPLLERYIDQKPGDAAGWLWLGYCLEDRAEATRCMRHAMDLDPTFMRAVEMVNQIPALPNINRRVGE